MCFSDFICFTIFLWITYCIVVTSVQLLSTDLEMIPARIAIDVHAQDFMVYDESNYLSREDSLAHWKLLEVLDVVSLYVVIGQSVAPTSSSIEGLFIARSPLHRTRHAYHSAGSSRDLWTIRYTYMSDIASKFVIIPISAIVHLRTTLYKKVISALVKMSHHIHTSGSSICLTFKRRIKSHLPFAGIIRSSPYSPRFQDNG